MNGQTGKNLPCRYRYWPSAPDDEEEPDDPPETTNIVPLRIGNGVAASLETEAVDLAGPEDHSAPRVSLWRPLLAR